MAQCPYLMRYVCVSQELVESGTSLKFSNRLRGKRTEWRMSGSTVCNALPDSPLFILLNNDRIACFLPGYQAWLPCQGNTVKVQTVETHLRYCCGKSNVRDAFVHVRNCKFIASFICFYYFNY